MTLIQRLTTGQTDGTTATTGNTGASQVNALGGSAITWRTAMGSHGETGLRFDCVSAQNCSTRFSLAGSSMTAQYRFRITTPAANPGAAFTYFSSRHASGNILRLIQGAPGNWYISDASSTNTVLHAAGVLAPSTQYDISIQSTVATTTTGSYTVKTYTTAGVQVGATVTITNANMGTAAQSAFDFGSGSSAATLTFGIVDVQANDGAGSEIPAFVSSTPLGTPILTGTGKTDPTAPGAADGTLTRSWDAIPGAVTYDAYVAAGSSPAQGDFTLVAAGVTSPHTWTGLSAGARSVGIKAKA